MKDIGHTGIGRHKRCLTEQRVVGDWLHVVVHEDRRADAVDWVGGAAHEGTVVKVARPDHVRRARGEGCLRPITRRRRGPQSVTGIGAADLPRMGRGGNGRLVDGARGDARVRVGQRGRREVFHRAALVVQLLCGRRHRVQLLSAEVLRRNARVRLDSHGNGLV